MNMFLKGIVELGITPEVPSDIRRGIRLVNSLSLISGASALVFGPLLTFLTSQPVMAPGFLEAACFIFSLYLNHTKHYFLSALVMLLTQNLAAVYFGILLGQGISVKMLFISLAITAVFIFRDLRVRSTGLLVAFVSMALINFNDYVHLIKPWEFTSTQHEMIKWLADGVIFVITCIAVLFFVQQNQRASENKTSFLRETNHEINKSLEAMTATVDKYLLQTGDAESVTIKMSDLQGIGMAARTMSDIVKAGLNLSKIEAGKYDHHELSLIETRILLKELIIAYAPLSMKKGIGIKVHVNDDVPKIFESDKNKLITILSNILLNAIKFSYNDSLVELDVQMQSSSMVFSITDFGKGINQKKLMNLFGDGLYVSEKNELIRGYGVGLALSKRYVDFLNGKLSVESEEGKGTCFTVEIPVMIYEVPMMVDHDLHKKADVAFHSSLLLAGKTILLIDDDRMTLEYGCQCFEMLGCKNVIMAQNAEDGIHKAQRMVPDLILIDVQLPDRNGLDVVKELRLSAALQDVLIITASSENSDILREKAAAAGASQFLQKPYTLSDIRNNIIRIFSLQA